MVHNFMDRTVTLHDLSALANGQTVAPPAPVVLNCVSVEKLAPAVVAGKQFFYDSRDTRVAFQQYVSCASCHNDGGHDGRVWDFTQFGEGLRNTITLRGRGGVAHGPLHWTGNFDEVQDFEGQIRNFAGGTGLMADSDFHAGTRSQPLGDPKSGLSSDLDALAAYVSSLSRHGQSPERNPDGSLTAAALSGRTIFQQQNCAQCHSGTRFTDSALGIFHDVGTLKPSSGGRLGGTLTGLDTPTLLGLFNTAPYLHDGSAASVEEAVSAHSGVSLTSTELIDLAAYLRQLDDTDAVAPAAVITWATPGAITYGSALSAAQLNATANTAGTFAYNPPLGSVLNAGNGRTLTVIFTPSELVNFSKATNTVTIDILRAPLVITAANKSKVYGASLPALTATYAGWVNGDSAANLDVPVALSTGATAASPVGAYAIVASGAADSNYSITFVNGSLTVTRAALTIRADNKSRPAGQANPVLTATHTGFVNGDTAASLDTPVTLATTATTSSPPGTYPITASGAADANYTITHSNGTMTVTATFKVSINFQPTGAAVPAGYLRDDGAVFGNRGNGYSYGWNSLNNNARDRNSSLSLDQRYDTLNHMQKSGSRTWEIGVPNGTYRVFLVSGDADHIDSVYRVNAEGVLTVSGTPTSSKRWISGSNTVSVTDGRLTVSNGSGSSNNKICFIDITAVTGIAPAAVPETGVVRLTGARLEPDGRITLYLENAQEISYDVEATSDFKSWELIGRVANRAGLLSFEDPAADPIQRYYRVRQP
jgi:hypothetical protein